MKNIYIDFTRVIMSLFVVMIHVHSFGGSTNIIGFIINQNIARMAVPFFFVLSGYFLYDKISCNGFDAWIRKLVKIYLTWTIIYLPFSTGIVYSLFHGSDIHLNATKIIYDLLLGYWHLWFLPSLMVGGCIVYAFKGKIKLLLISSVVIYISSCLLWYCFQYINTPQKELISLSIELRNGVFMGYPLIAIGYCMRYRQKETNLIGNINSLPLIITCILLIVIDCYISRSIGAVYDLTFSSLIVAPSILYFLSKKTPTADTKFSLSVLSLDIYLAHVMVIMTVRYAFPSSGWLIQLVLAIIFCLLYSTFKQRVKSKKSN